MTASPATRTATTTARQCPFDHHSADLRGDVRYDVYRDLAVDPVVRSTEHGGFWVVTGYEDIRALALDWKTYSSARGVFLPRDPEADFEGIESDPPKHTRSRKAMQELMSSRRLAAAEPHIRMLTQRYLAELARGGDGDFVEAVATKLPVEVIAHMIGLPEEIAVDLRVLTDRTWRQFFGDTDTGEPATAAQTALGELLFREVGLRREQPRDDYLTWLSTPDCAEPPLDPTEIALVLVNLAVAGHETTLNASTNLAYQFSIDPDLVERLHADPGLAPAAVEESLRHRAPVQNFFRTLTKDVELHGVRMSAGDKVMLLFGAGNRDVRKYPEPDLFDIDRTPQPHLAFGWGIHRCVGARLAQLELKIFVEELVRHYRIEPAGSPTFGIASGMGAFLGFETMPVRLISRHP